MKNLFDKYTPTIAVLLIFLVISTPVTGILLYNYWKGFIGSGHSFDGISAVISYASGIINIVTIIFLYINFHQQKLDNQKKDKETEFNKIVQLVQNQLVFTKEALKDKTIKSSDINFFKDVSFAFTGNIYDFIYIIYRQVNIYKRYLNNNLDDNDKSLIFSLICTNFLDDYIEDVKHINNLYENVKGNLPDKINEIVYYQARQGNTNVTMEEIESITNHKLLLESLSYWEGVKTKLYLMKNMVFDIKQTYDLHTNLLSKNHLY